MNKISARVAEGAAQTIWNSLRAATPSAMEVTWQSLTPEEQASIMSACEVLITTMTDVAIAHGAKESELHPDLHRG